MLRARGTMLLAVALLAAPGCLSRACRDGQAQACPCEGGPAGSRLCDGGVYAPCRCRRAEREKHRRKEREWERQREVRLGLINAGALLDLEIAKDTTPQRLNKIAERATIDMAIADLAARYPGDEAPGRFFAP